MRDKYVNEFSEQSLIYCGGYGIVCKVMHKNSGNLYAIKRIALNTEELEKAFKDLKLMTKRWVKHKERMVFVTERDSQPEGVVDKQGRHGGWTDALQAEEKRLETTWLPTAFLRRF